MFTTGQFSAPTTSISYVFQDLNKSVRVLQYIALQKSLVMGYEDGVSIWQCTPSKWMLVDCISNPCPDLPGVRTITAFGRMKEKLFIAGGFGHIIWNGVGEAKFFINDRRVCQIGCSSLSPDGKFLAVSTLDQHVHVWPLTPSGLLFGTGNTYHLETEHDYFKTSPNVPITMLTSNRVVSGSPVGQISLHKSNGDSISDFYFEHNISVTGLLSYEDRLYAAFMGPGGCVIIVGYSDKRGEQRAFNKLRDTHKSATPPTSTSIDIARIPKQSLHGPPRQTGRKGFDPQLSNYRKTWVGATVGLVILIMLYLLDIVAESAGKTIHLWTSNFDFEAWLNKTVFSSVGQVNFAGVFNFTKPV
ncbi:hypothetical protein FS749_011573 [Ceratobasidium sp. UAMH 11750]|nr:hypothetical protein FS749_011573 [Ceratobasidium sp. UAMH 11750]